MFYFIMLFPIGCAAALSLAARRWPADLVGLALHPYNLLGTFLLLITFDFGVLYQDVVAGISTNFSAYAISDKGAVFQGAVFFALCSVSLTAGVLAARPSSAFGALNPPHRNVLALRSANILMAVALGAAVFTSIQILQVSLSRGSLLYVAGVRQTFFRDNPLLYILYSVAVPAFIVFGSRYGLRPKTLFIAMFLVLLFLPLGSRGLIIFVLIACAYLWATRRALPVLALYLASPVVGYGLVLYRYLARDSYTYPTFASFLDAKGGVFGVLFRTPDISFAEVLTVTVNYASISRRPWDSLVGLVTAPLPRAWIPWKPMGASAQFTLESTPAYWALVKSEKTVTGFGNLVFDFGYVGAVVACGVLAWLWAVVIQSGARRGAGGLIGPLSIISMYIFLRGDLFNLAMFLWPVALVIGFDFALRNVPVYGRMPRTV